MTAHTYSGVQNMTVTWLAADIEVGTVEAPARQAGGA